VVSQLDINANIYQQRLGQIRDHELPVPGRKQLPLQLHAPDQLLDQQEQRGLQVL
jgi:hypothetical protein